MADILFILLPTLLVAAFLVLRRSPVRAESEPKVRRKERRAKKKEHKESRAPKGDARQEPALHAQSAETATEMRQEPTLRAQKSPAPEQEVERYTFIDDTPQPKQGSGDRAATRATEPPLTSTP